MKTLSKFRSLIGLVALLTVVVCPDLLGTSVPVIGAASFITTSINWGGKETLDYFISPMFVGQTPWETQGVRVMTNVRGKQQLNYFSSASKILKAYAKGFTAAAGVTYSQRELETVRFKAEMSEDGEAFKDSVFVYARKPSWNDISGTEIEKIVVEIFRNAVNSDIFRIFWLGDKYKETLSSGVYSGTPDTDYNMMTGIWKLIFADASTTPSATQIKRIAVSDGAVAQVQTATLTGTSGTCNIVIAGVNYLATFDTDITTTNDNWRALHGAALALRGITVGGTSTITLTSAIPGQPFATVTVSAALSGNLTGSVAATTANTPPSALSAGEAEDIFNSLYVGADKVLKEVPKSNKVFLVSDLIYENYETYLEGLGVSESYRAVVNGLETLTYRGIPIIKMGWDLHLDNDFPHASGYMPAYPHRVIYTERNNLVLGIDVLNTFTATDMWFNKDAEENRFRTKFYMGANYVHNKLMAVAY